MSFFRDRNCYMKDYNLSLMDKLRGFNYLYLFIVSLIVFIGIGVLYSVGNGHFSPWASKQSFRFIFSLGVLLIIALTNLRLWMKYAYWIYGVGLALLIGVELLGHIHMGAQRWLNLGVLLLSRDCAITSLSCFFIRRKSVSTFPNVMTSTAIQSGSPFEVSYVCRKCSTKSSLLFLVSVSMNAKSSLNRVSFSGSA